MKAIALPGRLRESPPAVLLYMAAIFALGFTFDGGIFSVLQNLYLLRLGYGTEFIGAFNSAGLFVFALLSLPIGAIQRWSSRQLLLLGIWLLTAGMLIVPLAQWGPESWQAFLLMSGRIVSFVGLAFFFVHSPPFLLAITSGEWQHRALAWQTAVLSLAGFVGGALGGYLPGWFAGAMGLALDDPTPYQLPLLIATGLFLLALFPMRRTPEPDPVKPNEAETTIGDSFASTPGWAGPIALLVIFIALVRILQVAAPGAIFSFTNVYLDDALGVSTSRIGLVTAIGRLFSVPVALITPLMLARWGGYRLVIWVSILSAVATLPLALPLGWEMASLGYILTAAIGPIRYLAFLVFSFSLVNPERRAIISGAGEMSIGMGFALSAFAGGYLIADYGYNQFYIVSLAASVLGTAVFWLLFRRSR